ncbi:hypothetical protein TNCV_4675511 [Trichonephila clavipes]|nr:hypothetical protein TNCV_4675511 [Trichonephila clavipes]
MLVAVNRRFHLPPTRQYVSQTLEDELHSSSSPSFLKKQLTDGRYGTNKGESSSTMGKKRSSIVGTQDYMGPIGLWFCPKPDFIGRRTNVLRYANVSQDTNMAIDIVILTTTDKKISNIN